ncbi:SH2 domain-containing protein 1B [Parambassis ranga]|uniref:SH2 domain-containing protein 1B n=1 Tax=Parambassis ranga TaxID=210632 RepID=A0A6P7KIT6_9TELE|nr:SH2 domain-containing protein 1B-like [Parambassis ranga]
MAAALPACYHGAMSRKECEDVLGKKNKDGAYLLRDSETIQGALCLCVYKQKVVYTYRLLQAHNGQYTLVTAGGLQETFFKTLDDLIHHYKRKNQGLTIHLRRAVKRKTDLLIQPQRKLPEPPPRNEEREHGEHWQQRDYRDQRELRDQREHRDQRDQSDQREWRGPPPEAEEEHDYENSLSEYVEVLPDPL